MFDINLTNILGMAAQIFNALLPALVVVIGLTIGISLLIWLNKVLGDAFEVRSGGDPWI